jgi:tetratricopeptide (TPR) repeat protein/4-amino-4-deoxy-L-arabinose transferase-like glycosyltransferase
LIASLKKHLFLLVACASLFTAGILRLNDLSIYTPDSTRYIIWGNSIAHGSGFLDATRPEADRSVTHAPFYAVLIAPVELFFPLSVMAVKVWTLLFGVACVVLFYYYVSRMIGRTAARIGTILLVCNPLLLIYSSEALSEAPFIALTLLILLLVERVVAGQRPRVSFAILILCLAFAGLLREVGVAVVFSVAFYFAVLKQWRRALLVSASAAVILGLWYLRNHVWVGGVQSDHLSLIFQNILTDPGLPIVNELALRIVTNLGIYASQIGGMILYPVFVTQQLSLETGGDQLYTLLEGLFVYGKILVVVLTVPVLSIGVYRDARNSPTAIVRTVLASGYLLTILVYPITDVRLLAPLLPLTIFYSLIGARWILLKREEVQWPASRYVLASFLLMLPNIYCIGKLISINLTYRSSPAEFRETLMNTPSYPAVFTRPWPLFGEWIRSNLPPDAVIASPMKDLAIVAGGRKVLELNHAVELPVFESQLRDKCVDYLAAPVRWGDFMSYEFLMRESERFRFELVYRVANLNLYRVYSRFEKPDVPDTPRAGSGDSTTAANLLRKGREELLAERYVDAVQTLTRAVERDSLQPETAYQCMIAHLMLLDKPGAMPHYRRQFILPLAGVYFSPARAELSLCDLAIRARQATTHDERSLKTLEAAQQYWKLGYYRRAKSLLDSDLESDSLFFRGLLWGFHFNFQLHDAARSRRYLDYLKKMDDSNQVVRAFVATVAIEDSLGNVREAGRRSRLHLSLARIFDKIELNDEALDEAQRAAGEDSNAVDPWKFLGNVYERSSRLRAARRAYSRALLREPTDTRMIAKLDSLERLIEIVQSDRVR